jgi:hypothetical protein
MDFLHPDKKPRLQHLTRQERLATRLRIYVKDQARPGRHPRVNDRGVDHELDLLVRRMDPTEMAEILDGDGPQEAGDPSDSGPPPIRAREG